MPSVLTRGTKSDTQRDYQTSLGRSLSRYPSAPTNSRLIVICPYQQLNIFFEGILPRTTPDVTLECIAHSDFNHAPYIQVEEREREKPLPLYILDFQRIITEVSSLQAVVQFSGYDRWRKGKRILYITPRKEFANQLSALHEYDGQGNFNPTKPDIKPFQKGLEEDLRTILYSTANGDLLRKESN
ncbi:MAG: hypothetical protein RL557_1027 [archaeon]|jgi:hypothetical protein